MSGTPRSILFPYTTLFRSPDVLDSALLRPGRFDRKITLDRPHKEAREAILKVHVRKVPLAADVDLAQLRSEEHTSELQSRPHLVCRLLLEKKTKSRLRAQS